MNIQPLLDYHDARATQTTPPWDRVDADWSRETARALRSMQSMIRDLCIGHADDCACRFCQFAFRREPKVEPDGPITATAKCSACGHVQEVRGFVADGRRYLGSGINWCDKCGDGKPHLVGVARSA